MKEKGGGGGWEVIRGGGGGVKEQRSAGGEGEKGARWEQEWGKRVDYRL